ncbi:MAG: hypothetical protein GY754_39905 [bacterium]|nr:hypothetical protein [bacterium]
MKKQNYLKTLIKAVLLMGIIFPGTLFAENEIIWQHDNGQVHYWQIENGVRISGTNINIPVDASSR